MTSTATITLLSQERYSRFREVQQSLPTRQRGAKRAATYHALSSYSLHFLMWVAIYYCYYYYYYHYLLHLLLLS